MFGGRSRYTFKFYYCDSLHITFYFKFVIRPVFESNREDILKYKYKFKIKSNV